MEPQAVILIGIQAAGKSSFYFQQFADTHIRLNLDMLKTRHREEILLEACLKVKQSFVVDNTNVTAADRARYIDRARAAGFQVIGYYFESTLSDALARNRGRAKIIPEIGVAATSGRLQPPGLDEGFDKLYRVRLGAPNEFIVRPWRG